MAVEKTRGTKTQSLSLRLDPKTKFILDFMARIKGQSITTIVERAVKEVAEGAGIGLQWDSRGDEMPQHIWSDFWDPSEGVRALRLFANPHYPTTFDEDELRAFTMLHSPFFYTNPEGNKPRRTYVEILWPSMGKYLEIWREKKTEDYWAAGETMKADLSAARVKPPEWPPKAPAKSPPSSPTQEAGDLDDEIPF